MKKKIMAAFTAAVLALSSVPAYAEDLESVENPILGDVDGSGSLTANDAATALLLSLNSQYDEVADVNRDGIITANDAAWILQRVLFNTDYPTTGNETESTTETPTETTTENITETTTSAYYDFRADELTETQGVALSSSIVQGAFTAVPSIKVGTREVEVNGENYTQFLQLNSTGSTSSACVYFDVPCDGTLTVIARSSNATTVRSLVIVSDKGDSATFDMPVSGDAPAVCTTTVTGGSRCYFYGGKGNINIYRATFTTDGEIPTYVETTTEATTEPFESTETTTFNGDTSDGVVVDSFTALKSALSSGEKKIYVKGTLDCTENIKLETLGANVEIYGLTNDDGTAATLDFSSLRDARTSSGSGGTGITLNGSYYTFKNLIIQKAGDCGIRIKGNHNTFENCVFRYNNNSGVSITDGGAYNTFLYVDSYRNADLIQKNGADADGFSVKLNAGENNKFYNCRAWENSDDGWDSYDRGTPYIGNVYYVECVTWNNGNPYVFTGEYDYEQGYALDKNLLYVQAILASDPDFETKYNNKEVTSWPELTVSLLGTSNTYSNIHSKNWAGNPNGFKFGSAETPSSSYRYIKNCIAFGHKNTPNQTPAKGFDQNNGSAGYDIINALSFDNGQNYWMGKMSAKSMSGVFYSFNSGQADDPGDLNLTTPSADKEKEIRSEVATKQAYILNMVNNNRIPGKVIFNVFE
jgi:hypothetical protein